MAKSTGNLVLVDDLLGEVPAAVIRLMLLNRPWSRSCEFHASELDTAAAALEALYSAAGRSEHDAAAARAVTDALLDDLDVPTALSVATIEGGDAARLLVRVLVLD